MAIVTQPQTGRILSALHPIVFIIDDVGILSDHVDVYLEWEVDGIAKTVTFSQGFQSVDSGTSTTRYEVDIHGFLKASLLPHVGASTSLEMDNIAYLNSGAIGKYIIAGDWILNIRAIQFATYTIDPETGGSTLAETYNYSGETIYAAAAALPVNSFVQNNATLDLLNLTCGQNQIDPNMPVSLLSNYSKPAWKLVNDDTFADLFTRPVAGVKHRSARYYDHFANQYARYGKVNLPTAIFVGVLTGSTYRTYTVPFNTSGINIPDPTQDFDALVLNTCPKGVQQYLDFISIHGVIESCTTYWIAPFIPGDVVSLFTHTPIAVDVRRDPQAESYQRMLVNFLNMHGAPDWYLFEGGIMSEDNYGNVIGQAPEFLNPDNFAVNGQTKSRYQQSTDSIERITINTVVTAGDVDFIREIYSSPELYVRFDEYEPIPFVAEKGTLKIQLNGVGMQQISLSLSRSIQTPKFVI